MGWLENSFVRISVAGGSALAPVDVAGVGRRQNFLTCEALKGRKSELKIRIIPQKGDSGPEREGFRLRSHSKLISRPVSAPSRLHV